MMEPTIPKFKDFDPTFTMKGPDPLQEQKKSMVKLIDEARKEALRRGIEVNSVVINKDMVEVPETWFNYGFGARSIPPMICGLNAYLTKDELPEGYSFAVLKGPEKNDRLRAFESIGMEPEELRKAADLYRHMKGVFENDQT